MYAYLFFALTTLGIFSLIENINRENINGFYEYLPRNYAADINTRYPLLVYLHGRTGSERNWVDAGRLNLTMDSLARAGAPEAHNR